MTRLRGLIQVARNPYWPELRYMRGPGPKWYAKHQARTENGAPISLALWVLIILLMTWLWSAPAGAGSYADCSITAINRSLERLPPGVLTKEELATISRELRLCTAVDTLKQSSEPKEDPPINWVHPDKNRRQ